MLRPIPREAPVTMRVGLVMIKEGVMAGMVRCECRRKKMEKKRIAMGKPKTGAKNHVTDADL